MRLDGTLLRRAFAVAACAVAALGLAAAPALAHDELLASDPADGAALDVAPAAIVLTFSSPVLEIGTGLQITAPDGTVMPLGPAVVDGPTVTQPLPEARPAGAYLVSWRAVSQDGHPVTGTLAFTAATGVAPAPTGTPTVPATAPTAPTPTPPPAPNPSPTTTSPVATSTAAPAPGGLSRNQRVGAVLATAAALIVLVGLGRNANLRRRRQPGDASGLPPVGE